jgi:hypothetical protein
MTPTELRRKVLEKLQVVAAGEPVHAADGLVVKDKYERLHEVLLLDDLIEWGVAEDIPEEYERVMIDMIAAECVSEFYCPPQLAGAIVAEGKFDNTPPSLAERRLRKLSAPGFNGDPAQPDYF